MTTSDPQLQSPSDDGADAARGARRARPLFAALSGIGVVVLLAGGVWWWRSHAARAAATDASSVAPGVRDVAGAVVLWVDDRPANNAPERSALRAMGLRVETSTSTADALQRVRAVRYTAIISDMKRSDSDTAGYVLLAALRTSGETMPAFFYSASATPALRDAARRRGAADETSDPQRLVELVLSAAEGRAPR